MGIHESRKQTSIICGCFSNINLGEDDEHVNAASIEALALIFENGRLEKFSNQAEEYASIKDMKDRIMNELIIPCTEFAGNPCSYEEIDSSLSVTQISSSRAIPSIHSRKF
ncbi:hypothetical protein BC332_22170 [Capsicum chinense]|nr:hypothetical protein BC332_22170 [Capsicum chinense]